MAIITESMFARKQKMQLLLVSDNVINVHHVYYHFKQYKYLVIIAVS